MYQPPYETFKRPTCRGCMALGNACGTCEKCAWEIAHFAEVQAASAPPPRKSNGKEVRKLAVADWLSSKADVLKAIEQQIDHALAGSPRSNGTFTVIVSFPKVAQCV